MTIYLNMKNILKFIPASLITTVVLAVFITAYYNLTPGFIALPNFVQQFNDLSNREVVDFIRYAYQTSVYGIVYGVYNVFTKQISIGSTIVPAKRVYEHLVSGTTVISTYRILSISRELIHFSS